MSNAILLVEDNPSDEKLALRAFKKCGVETEVIVVRDGAEALDFLFATGQHAGRSTSVRVAVVLLDLSLPRVDGHEVLRRVRADERTKVLPIVVLTASNEQEDVLRSYALGANAYVRKPVDFAEFTSIARTLAHFWLSMNQTPPRPTP
jgi:CheY-like chemotaxis protein